MVATPIGNLDDLSARARASIAEADAVLCEDTRRTAKLAAALGIQPRLERFDAHSGPGQVARLVERVLAGEKLALVTDAGTPAISDPGSALVAASHAAGALVVPVPGPSAVVTLLSAAGFEETAFVFRGFFPRKEGERKQELARCEASFAARVFVWFESPERVGEALQALLEASPGACVAAAKELTKIHERVFAGSAESVYAAVSQEIEREGARGEWVFAARFPEREEPVDDGSAWRLALQCLLECGVSASEAAKSVSRVFDAQKKRVYDEALKLSGKKA